MIVRRLFVASFALALCLTASADEPKKNPATELMNRDVPRHKEFLKKAKAAEGNVDVIFLGDSITQGWEGAGKKVWAETFAPMKAMNLGIGGDQTGHVLWRLTQGKELEHLKPKVAVLMIGTNNMGRHTPEQIAGGVKAIIDELHKQKPDMKILVLAIFPRSAKANDKIRKQVVETNKDIAKFADDKHVYFQDIGEKFLEKDGTLEKKIMPDLLHLSEAGYQIWADAIKDEVKRLMK